MRFKQIFSATIIFWPKVISISDAKMVEGKSGSFPTLSRIYFHIENKREDHGEWIDLMAWAIFCGLHQLAVEQFYKEKLSISTKNVNLKYVKRKFEESLSDEHYHHLWESYTDDLG